MVEQVIPQKQTPLSREEILHMLENEYGVTAEESTVELPAGEIQRQGFEGLSPNQQQRIDTAAERCKAYLSGPIIKDKFGSDHFRRREWRDKLAKKHGPALSNYFENNKLRAKNFIAIHSLLTMLVEDLERKKIRTPESEKVRDILRRFPDFSRYNEMDLDEKLLAVSQLESTALEFITLVTKHV